MSLPLEGIVVIDLIMSLPLEGIVVIDLARMLPGPYASMILADLGAEVIRVEDPRYPYGSPPPFFQKGRYREPQFEEGRSSRNILQIS